MVREAGLEVAVPDLNNFLMLNYVINSSESILLCTTQSIDFMWCDSVKGQIRGQSLSLYKASYFSLTKNISPVVFRSV